MGKAQVSVYDGPVVIVGAGVAGLVTAHLLAEAGADVVVIEKLPIVGGLARSFQYDEFVSTADHTGSTPRTQRIELPRPSAGPTRYLLPSQVRGVL